MRNWCVFLFGCVAAFLLAEGALRGFLRLAGDPTGSPYVRDAACGYRLRPEMPDSTNAEDHVNAFGFRDREHPRQKPPQTYRILGIGDSFVYATVPPSRNFLRVAAQHLATARTHVGAGVTDGKVEMVLLGLGGYSTANQVGLLRTLGRDLEPDLVILNFFVGNDVTGIPVRGEVLRGRLYYVGSPARWRNVFRKSRLYVLAEMFYVTQVKARYLRRPVELVAPEATPQFDAFPQPPLTRDYVEVESRNLPVYLDPLDQTQRELWRQALAQLDAFDAVCRDMGVPWVLHVIPEELQIDADVRREVLRQLRLEPTAYDFDGPQRRLAAFAVERGIAIHDPLPELRRLHRSEDRLYVPNNTHWGERGNRAAGELLGGFLEARLRSGGGAGYAHTEADGEAASPSRIDRGLHGKIPSSM